MKSIPLTITIATEEQKEALERGLHLAFQEIVEKQRKCNAKIKTAESNIVRIACHKEWETHVDGLIAIREIKEQTL